MSLWFSLPTGIGVWPREYLPCAGFEYVCDHIQGEAPGHLGIVLALGLHVLVFDQDAYVIGGQQFQQPGMLLNRKGAC